MKKLTKLPLLAKVGIAVVLGVGFSFFTPLPITRIFETFNGLFSNFLNFIIPVMIVGLVAPGITEIGKGAGKMLGSTAGIAYFSTICAGLFAYAACVMTYPHVLDFSSSAGGIGSAFTSQVDVEPYFTVDMPPVFGVMSALILSFILGLTLTFVQGDTLRKGLVELRDLVMLVISKVIIPLLPLYIFGIFLKMGTEGVVMSVIGLFLKVIVVIFIIHILLLVIQFVIAGAIAGRNPFKALKTMLPAYFTALGTQSSAATIPVTLAQAKRNGVRAEVADFVIPLCATIHLAGSTLKIVACAIAISFMSGTPHDLGLYFEFIMMLGITMVAAPGVPGGAIMAALGIISSILGFDTQMQELMIALYIAMDSFGTACNVTGDGAIAMIVDRMFSKNFK